MSITDYIKHRIAALEGSRLFSLPPVVPVDEVVREVFISEEVYEIVMPPWPENYDGSRQAGHRGDLDAFTLGDRFSVAEDPFKKPFNAMLARTHPVSDEIWDMRTTDPLPGIRSLGAFGGKDLFIALVWDYRENFDGDPDHWDFEINRCKTKWDELFGSIPRFKGTSLDEYLSNYHAV